MLNLTANEKIVLQAFDTYSDVESTISDLGVSWTGTKELAAETKLSVASIKGILGSLTKKGLVESDDNGENIAVCLTKEGAVEAHILDNMLAIPVMKPQASATIGSEIASALGATPAEEPAPVASSKKGTCAYLRARATGWEATRKEFIEAMVAEGINKATATTQWQRARGGKTE